MTTKFAGLVTSAESVQEASPPSRSTSCDTCGSTPESRASGTHASLPTRHDLADRIHAPRTAPALANALAQTAQTQIGKRSAPPATKSATSL